MVKINQHQQRNINADHQDEGAYTVLIWVYLYLQRVYRHGHKRPYFYQISVLALYLFITIISILSILALYQEAISTTTLQIALNSSSSELDSHIDLYLKLK